MTRLINSAGLALIKEYEGCRLEAYLDIGGVPTIGYGHVHGAKMGDTCSHMQAEDWLEADLMTAEAAVSECVKDHVTDNQFAALVSFTFNLGKSSLQKLLSHGIDAIPAQILRWDHDNGKEIEGLKRRRKAEANLWSMK